VLSFATIFPSLFSRLILIFIKHFSIFSFFTRKLSILAGRAAVQTIRIHYLTFQQLLRSIIII